MMSENTYKIILTTFFGLLGSIIIGLIFYGDTIFFTRNPNFQFITFGFSGSLLFALLEYKSLKEQLLTFLLILIIEQVLITGKYISLGFVIRDILFLVSLFISISIYFRFIKKNSSLKFYFRSSALVAIYGVINAIAAIIVYLINAGGFPPLSFIVFIARYGILIGFGIAIGIDVYLQNEKRIIKIF